MVVKQKGVKKKVVVRHEPGAAPPKAEPEKKEPLVPKAPMSNRTKEDNPGFGVLKGVAGVILLLIVGSAILFNRAGGKDAMRGDKALGETCEETTECQKGTICFSYQGDAHRCMKTCSHKHPCPSGQTCMSAASSKRKGIRVTEVCIPDAVE